MKFLKIDNYWWELEGNKVFNSVGGYHYADSYDKSKAVEADEWSDLDWTSTDVYDNEKYKTGWIDRNGVFYGCNSYSHRDQAEYIHKKTEPELEHLGWIKVYTSNFTFIKNCVNGLKFSIIKHRINELQRNKLRNLGFLEGEINEFH